MNTPATGVIRAIAFFVALAASVAAPISAFAVDYRSIGGDPAVMYDAPTDRGHKIWIAPRSMPVELILIQGDWARVRDSNGDLAWVKKDALSDKRTVVTKAAVSIHANADDASPVAFRAQPGVVLDLVEAPNGGWVHVRHRDGSIGWLHVAEVWGD